MKNKFDGKDYYDELKDMAKEVLENVKKEVMPNANKSHKPQGRGGKRT